MGILDKVKKKKEVPPSNVSSALPDTAQDVFDGPAEVTSKPTTSVNNNPVSQPSSEPAPPTELPSINFGEFKAKKQKQPAKPEPPVAPVQHQIVSESLPPMDNEIKQFEDAVSHIYTEDSQQETPTDNQPEPSAPRSSQVQGFFSQFENYLEGNDVPEVAGEMHNEDVLKKMKEFHEHREKGEKHLMKNQEMKNALRDNLQELQDLEDEWIRHKSTIGKEQSMLEEKERELAERIEDMKELMQKLKITDKMSVTAPDNRYFNLANGQIIKSVSELADALRTINDETFAKHLKAGSNDFAEWMGDVFGRDELYSLIRSCSSREQMIRILTDRKSS